MIKHIFLIWCFLILADFAICQNKDTVITYYKFSAAPFGWKIKNPDSADYVRVIYPSPTGTPHDIREYYANGSIKLMGTVDLNANEYGVKFVGDFISYYQNGKKQSTSHYTDGRKLGLEYLFRPDGKLYAVENWVDKSNGNNYLCWEFYDLDGNMICQNGNGKWLIYDDFHTVVLSGNIKDGYREGQWKGFDVIGDTINYVFNYKKNIFISGIGYDKSGHMYSFKTTQEDARYKTGSLLTFAEDLNRHLVLPKDSNGRKMNIDTVHISFVIEKDGSVTNVEPLGNVNPNLKVALNIAITKCDEWTPTRFYGIPYRTLYTISLNVQKDFTLTSVTQKITYKGNIIADRPHNKINVSN